MIIRDLVSNDVPAITDIYNHYISNTVITFEIDPVQSEEMDQRRTKVQRAGFPWIVCENETTKTVEGYAYAYKWQEREAYRFVVESTIYLRPGSERQGIGSKLYTELLNGLADGGYKAVIAKVALPNEKSVGFHEALGFKPCGVFRGVGYKFDKWVDIGAFQLELENWKSNRKQS